MNFFLQSPLLKSFLLASILFLSESLVIAQGSPFTVRYQSRIDGNHPYVELAVLPVQPSTTFGLRFSFANTNGETIVQDSINLSIQNSLVVNNTLIHRISSPDISQTLAFTFILSYRGEVIVQQGISVPAAEDNLGFSLKNVSDASHTNYVVAGEQLQVVNTQASKLFIYKLNQDFQASPPPMYSSTLANTPALTIDTLFEVPTNQPFVLNEPALYYAQTDTSQRLGQGIKVVPEDYPKFRKVKRVIEPMLYISTQTETQTLRGVDEPKDELDAFWLNLGGSPENARRIIKRYFQRVTYANHVFTNYKQGWKTDRGIVYVIFGAPSRKIATANKMTWVYLSSKGEEAIRFEFERKPNQFTGYHYELVRDSNYKGPWNNVIKLWRNGLIR